MKRVIVLLLVLVAIGLVAFGVRRELAINAKKNRRAAYEAKLRSFAQVLQPGMTRKQVQDYFHANDITYSEGCCVAYDNSVKRQSFDDLVKVGEEDHPWYCSEHWVYVAFQFTDYGTRTPEWHIKDNDLDTLKSITIYEQLGGCL